MLNSAHADPPNEPAESPVASPDAEPPDARPPDQALESPASPEPLADAAAASAAPAGPDATRDSVSCGSANRGALSEAAMLPRSGPGFETPGPWWDRGRRYGTDELVSLIIRAAASVDKEHPGAILGVADLSARGGGAIAGHRSHQSGRDADLIYYALDPQGQPFRPDEHMAYYSYSGRARYAQAPTYARNIPERYFDMARNWALVKALMTDAHAPVEHIFVSDRVRKWLLRYADSAGEPEEIIDRARRLLKRPQSTGGHNDHMHIRISCTADDMARGRCKNSIARKRGRKKFYSRVRCPATPVAATPVAEK